MIASFFMLGCFSFSFQENNHTKKQHLLCNSPCCIRGTITSIDTSKQKYLNTVITIKLTAIKQKQLWQKISCSIFIYTRKQQNLLVGDTIELQNIVFKKPSTESFNLYLTKIGIVAVSFEKNLSYVLISRPKFCFYRFINEKKQNLYNRLKQKCCPKTFSLFSSIFLGNKSHKSIFFEKTKEKFKVWGILHFLARSGLHLVIFIMVWEWILAFIPFSFFVTQIILLFFGGIYYIFSWTSTSFIRAFFIFFLYKASPFFDSKTNLVHLLTIICFTMLLFNPVQLLFLDFQLSFVLTFALAWFNQLLRSKKIFTQNC